MEEHRDARPVVEYSVFSDGTIQHSDGGSDRGFTSTIYEYSFDAVGPRTSGFVQSPPLHEHTSPNMPRAMFILHRRFLGTEWRAWTEEEPLVQFQHNKSVQEFSKLLRVRRKDYAYHQHHSQFPHARQARNRTP